MDARIYDWDQPTNIEQSIERKLDHADLPEAALARLQEVRTSIEQMREDCKRLAIFS
jgi:hypothetical protein